MKIITLIFISLLLAGCGGRDFVRPQSDSLSLGKTTYEEIVAKYGDPRRTGTVMRNNVSVKTITYSHSVSVPFSTKFSSRGMVFSFLDDVLVGYDYASSFSEDKNENDISDEKIKQLSKGDGRARVISLFGSAGGEFIYPLVEQKGTTQIRYTFLDTYRIPFGFTGPRVTQKNLSIILNSDDIVTDISSSESQPN